MKSVIAKYMLYIYLKSIKEDWEVLEKWAIPLLKPAWFVRSILVWISSVIFFPIFYFGMIFEEKLKKYEKFYI